MTANGQRRIAGSFLVIALLATAVLGVEGYSIHETRKLAAENQKRADENRALIAEQQASRLRSCRQTYEAFNEVFKPFFPPKGKRSTLQQSQLNKLNRTVAHFKRQCKPQTSTKGVKP